MAGENEVGRIGCRSWFTGRTCKEKYAHEGKNSLGGLLARP